jgi:chromosome segregation ATPase
MFIKRTLKIGLVAIVASALTTMQAQVPKPAPKPDKEKPERGGKKWDSEKVKKRLKAAFENRKKHRGDAKKRGHKVHHKGKSFGKFVSNDDKVKQLRKDFAEAAKKIKGGLDKSKFKDATDEQKEALREKMKAAHKEWAELTKSHRKEVRERIEEIKKEFKNKRDKVIDANDPGE